jgi:hypothetical protein
LLLLAWTARCSGARIVGLRTSLIMASALRMYMALEFARDREPPPVRDVPHRRYMLAVAGIDVALAASDKDLHQFDV